MGFNTDNLSLYHTFSKTPVDSNTSSAAAQLGNAINKSGHTVQSNEIWTESIPFFGLAATTTAIHNKFSATAKVNDLVKDADGKIWQRNNVEYTANVEFADLWFEKTTSITSTMKDADGNYPTAAGALLDGSYLLNSEGIPTVKYYEKRLLTRLTADNNANTNSDNKASRLQIDGKWIDQFIGVTDIYLNGSAAVSYAPVLRKDASSSPMQAGPEKGYMDYCATGLILWESSAAGTEVIDCFEYVGAKLNTALTTISDSVKDIINTTMQGVVASVGTTDKAAAAGISVDSSVTTSPKIDITTGSISTGETKLVTGGAVAAVTDALSGRIAQLEGIQHFSVAVVDTLPTTLVENTIYLVPEEGSTTGTYVEYIAYKPEGSETVTTERIGTTAIDLEGYTTDAEHEALQGRVSTAEGQIATITSTDSTKEGSIAKALADAKTYAEGQASDAQSGAEQTAAAALSAARTEITAEIAQAKSEAIASAEVTITAGTGIVVTGEGKGTTFQIAVSDDVATAASVSALSQVVASNKTELEGKITAVETAASTALETAKTEINGTTDALDGRLQTAEGKVSTLEGQVATLTTGDNSVAKQIETAANAIKGQSLAQTGTLSGMFSVTTDGSVGTGITSITISDTGLSTAIADAKSGAEQTAATALSTARGEITTEITTAVSGLETKLTTGDGSLGAKVTALEDSVKTINETTIPNAITTAQNGAVTTVKALTLTASDSDDAAKVTVTLGGTVETPTITVTSSDIASAQTLSELSSKVNTHIEEAAGLYLSVEKVTQLPADADAKTNKIYLVPLDTEEGREKNIHTEYIWTNNQWEVIGTTAIDMNSLEAAAEAA